MPYYFSKVEICYICYGSKTIIKFDVKLYNELNKKDVLISLSCNISDIIDDHKTFPFVNQNFDDVYKNLILIYVINHFDNLIIPQLIHHI